MRISIILLTSLVALSPASATAAASHGHAGRPFISPMGEPFVGVQGTEALGFWFAQADSNRDGSLTLTEMQADAERFFGLLDTNHDGEIDPDETTNYEQVIAPMDRARFGLFGL